MEAKTPMTKDYDDFSITQLAGNLLNIGRVTEALLSFHQDSTIHIADFGSATGLNTMKTFTPALQKLREISNSEVVMHHVDLPINHWEKVFDNYWNSEFSYRQVSGVYAEAVGGSMYQRLFPANSLSIAYSTSALHWLSKYLPVTEDMTIDNLEQAKRTLSNQDLYDFLMQRYVELRPGGRVIIRNASISFHWPAFIHCFTHSPELSALPERFFHAVSNRVQNRSIEDYRSMLDSSFTGKYRVIELSEESREPPTYTALRQDGNREKFATRMVAELRSAATSSLEMVLKSASADIETLKRAFFDEATRFYKEIEELRSIKEVVLVLEKTEI